MRTRERLKHRRAINHELAINDRANRCVYCKLALGEKRYTREDGLLFCSRECLTAQSWFETAVTR